MSSRRVLLASGVAGCAFALTSWIGLGIGTASAAADPGGVPHHAVSPAAHGKSNSAHWAAAAGAGAIGVDPSGAAAHGPSIATITGGDSPGSPLVRSNPHGTGGSVHAATVNMKLAAKGHKGPKPGKGKKGSKKAPAPGSPTPTPAAVGSTPVPATLAPLPFIVISAQPAAAAAAQVALAQTAPAVTVASHPVSKRSPAAYLGPLGSAFVAAAGGGALAIMSLRSPISWPLPIALVVVVMVLFFLLQGRIDRRDPKVVRAPLRSDEDTLGFD